jgi:precorrin-3B synthase
VDACPGALQLHQAADGWVARVRVPGGRVTGTQLLALLRAAPDGTVELTSRANLQVRGVDEGFGELAASVGLLPSATHERVRNILGSPLGDVGELVRSLDRELCARPALAGLPGRFLFAVDDGRGDVAWLDADVAVLVASGVVLLGGLDVGLRAPRDRIASTLLTCAERFLALRTREWRLAELPDGSRRVAEGFALVDSRVARPAEVRPPVGAVGDAVVAAVPLGRLHLAQGEVLAAMSEELVITPWRGVVVPGGGLDRLRAVGLLVDPDAPGIGVSACTGRPGCAKALADVRADALAMIAGGARPSRPVHWSGCARRCGRPRGEVVDVMATEDGYVVR